MSHERRPWLILLLLLAAVLALAACVLWFMSQAVRNERMAVRQKLTDLYRPVLAAAADHAEQHWNKVADALAEGPEPLTAPERFAQLVNAGLCASVIIYGRAGEVLYPGAAGPPTGRQEPDGARWTQARLLEFDQPDLPAAAEAYAAIAERSADRDEAALALQARARCLAKAGKQGEALNVILDELAAAQYREARDTQGRLIGPNALLMAAEADAAPPGNRRQEAVDLLVARLTDYGPPPMLPAQRRFLLSRLSEVAPGAASLRMLEAEELAAQYVRASLGIPAFGGLRPAPLDGVWQIVSADRTAVGLLKHETVIANMTALLNAEVPLTEATVGLEPPGGPTGRDERAPFLTVAAGRSLPDWHLALYLEGRDPFREAARRQVAAYVWTGALTIAVAALVGAVIARHLLRQMRVTRLKNDFIATVSHELKTPLSSMRVLVDTLLEGHYRDQQQVTEYLQLLAQENERLSSLIDNFLSFSRMERDKRALEFAACDPAELAEAAARAVRGKFERDGCRFEVDIAPDLPTITADRDAVLTVLLNLLDNACKYSEDERHICLRAYASDGSVCFEVTDNGVGMSRRAARHAFDRFYQADRSLSRRAGGYGLGLSIVKFIVDAHGGEIGVESRLGEGSTFTVKLPV